MNAGRAPARLAIALVIAGVSVTGSGMRAIRLNAATAGSIETLQPAPPVLTAPVNDFANVIDPASESELDRRIRALQAASKDVVVVATIPTFQPYADIEEYAVKMFENSGRGIGEKGKDNGLLIVVAART